MGHQFLKGYYRDRVSGCGLHSFGLEWDLLVGIYEYSNGL